MIKYSHNKKCFACDQPRPKALLGYDLKTLKTYCTDDRCLRASAIPTKELHPLEAETLELVLKNNEDLNKLIGKSVSARLQPYLAMHILETAKRKGFASINETLLYILDCDFEHQEDIKQGPFTIHPEPMPEPIKEYYDNKLTEILHTEPMPLFEEVHKQMEEEAPTATPKVQEILDQVSEKLEEVEPEVKYDIPPTMERDPITNPVPIEEEEDDDFEI